MQPFEIVCAPYTVWTAPVGTAFPTVDEDPTPPTPPSTPGWVTWGTSGDKNYTDDGVAISHGETVNTFTPAGGTMPRKAWRTDETLTISFTIADLSPEQYAMALDNAAITTVAATGSVAGTKSFELMRGVEVGMAACLVRGISPVDETLTAQYKIPAVYQSGTPAPTFSKQNPAELAIELTAFELTPGTIGTLEMQTAAKTS
jgi:hypothetical protein